VFLLVVPAAVAVDILDLAAVAYFAKISFVSPMATLFSTCARALVALDGAAAPCPYIASIIDREGLGAIPGVLVRPAIWYEFCTMTRIRPCVPTCYLIPAGYWTDIAACAAHTLTVVITRVKIPGEAVRPLVLRAVRNHDGVLCAYEEACTPSAGISVVAGSQAGGPALRIAIINVNAV